MKLSVLILGGSTLVFSLTSFSDFAQAGNLCDFASGTYAPLNPKDFGPAVLLRSKGAAAGSSPIVWSLTKESRFATQCPVKSIRLSAHPGTACSDAAASALHDGDQVRVNEWGKDQFELAVWRAGRSAFHPSQGPVLLQPVYVEAQGTRLIGYHADNVLVNAKDLLGPPVPVSFYVYLRKNGLGGDRVRWYDIEVFSNDPECWKEIPGSPDAGTELADGRAGRDSGGVTPSEYPSGGGGEAPPG
ncbi:MAG: hypothetical protein ABIR16_01340 [Dokdonella sp.]